MFSLWLIAACGERLPIETPKDPPDWPMENLLDLAQPVPASDPDPIPAADPAADPAPPEDEASGPAVEDKVPDPAAVPEPPLEAPPEVP